MAESSGTPRSNYVPAGAVNEDTDLEPLPMSMESARQKQVSQGNLRNLASGDGQDSRLTRGLERASSDAHQAPVSSHLGGTPLAAPLLQLSQTQGTSSKANADSEIGTRLPISKVPRPVSRDVGIVTSQPTLESSSGPPKICSSSCGIPPYFQTGQNIQHEHQDPMRQFPSDSSSHFLPNHDGVRQTELPIEQSLRSSSMQSVRCKRLEAEVLIYARENRL